MHQSLLSRAVEALVNQEYTLFLDLFSNLGAVGFIFWLTWRTTNHTIPRLAKSFEESIQVTREDFKSILKQQREDFRAILEQNREFFARQADNERAQLEKLTMAIMSIRTTGGPHAPIE
jgi:hypothetical protein